MFFLIEKEPIQVICHITQEAGVKDLKHVLLGKVNNGLYWPRHKSLISLNLGF